MSRISRNMVKQLYRFYTNRHGQWHHESFETDRSYRLGEVWILRSTYEWAQNSPLINQIIKFLQFHEVLFRLQRNLEGISASKSKPNNNTATSNSAGMLQVLCTELNFSSRRCNLYFKTKRVIFVSKLERDLSRTMQRTWLIQSDAYKEKFLWTRKVGWELRSLEIQKKTKTPQHRRQTENANFVEGSDLNSRRPVSSIREARARRRVGRVCVYAVSQRSSGPDAERRSLIRPVFYDNKAATLCANPVWKCHPHPGRRVLIHSHLLSFYQSSCSCLVTRRSPRLLCSSNSLAEQPLQSGRDGVNCLFKGIAGFSSRFSVRHRGFAVNKCRARCSCRSPLHQIKTS